MSATVDLTLDLISRNSVTPADQGCQEVMTRRLAEAGFQIENLRYGNVDNFWATRGRGGPVLCFAGPHRRGAHRARSRSGRAIRSSPRCATACSTAAAPPT